MTIKITRQVLEAFLYCKTKAHLKLASQEGIVSDYEALLAERRQEVKERAFGNILTRHSQAEVVRECWLTPDVLQSGPTFLLEPFLETDRFSLRFDGLKRADGPSRLGEFHYVPILLHEGNRVRKEQRFLLELFGLILSSVQGRQPESGLIIYGDQGTNTKVRLASTHTLPAQRYLHELEQLAESASCPKLMLNDHCQTCEFKEKCHAQALKDDDLSLLHGMGEKEIRRYNRKGIFTLTQLSCTFRPRNQSKRTKKRGCSHYPALQALAIRENRMYVNGTPKLPDPPVRVFLDVEGNMDGSFIYLIGMTVCEHESERNCSFWADTPDQEQQIFDSFLNVLSDLDHPCVYHYGSYEARFLRRMIDRTSKAKLAKRILDGTTNVLSVIHSAIYFPTLSNGLKDIGRFLGCQWTHHGASGIQSLVWRRRWEQTSKEAIKDTLITYNLEDCAALRRITECVYTIIEAGKGRGTAEASGKTDIPIEWTEEFRSPSSRPNWRGQIFALPAFEAITKCAYFDYQREKVFLRTSTTIRRSCTKTSERRRRKLRANREVTIRANRCPHCGSSDIARCAGEKHVKVAYDLRFSESGIRRQVIHCTTRLHTCRDCHTAFLPERYKRREKHFHGLKSWVMYQHVVHRISLSSLPSMLQDCFALHVLSDELYTIRSLMAQRYRATWKAILRKMLAGDVIHIDETQVGLQRSKGYVWVLTSLEEVIYIYRDTREGDFLEDLLKDYAGVIISDFYSAYDSLPCKQQKCLIHLIRDLNSDLLSEPFNEEFKKLAFEFGELLRSIIVTIDRHGLQTRHMHKHKVDVGRLFGAMSHQQFHSELAVSYQKRLLKYRQKLFTFLDHDGVPWNNNNAECAIKQFAEFRKLFDGRLRKPGLDEYLVLLSIQQTCKYKGISFLTFLLSRESDVDTCAKVAHRKYQPPDFEIYPSGYPRKYLLKRREGNRESEK